MSGTRLSKPQREVLWWFDVDPFAEIVCDAEGRKPRFRVPERDEADCAGTLEPPKIAAGTLRSLVERGMVGMPDGSGERRYVRTDFGKACLDDADYGTAFAGQHEIAPRPVEPPLWERDPGDPKLLHIFPNRK